MIYFFIYGFCIDSNKLLSNTYKNMNVNMKCKYAIHIYNLQCTTCNRKTSKLT